MCIHVPNLRRELCFCLLRCFVFGINAGIGVCLWPFAGCFYCKHRQRKFNATFWWTCESIFPLKHSLLKLLFVNLWIFGDRHISVALVNYILCCLCLAAEEKCQNSHLYLSLGKEPFVNTTFRRYDSLQVKSSVRISVSRCAKRGSFETDAAA